MVDGDVPCQGSFWLLVLYFLSCLVPICAEIHMYQQFGIVQISFDCWHDLNCCSSFMFQLYLLHLFFLFFIC
uniref:Uncharacterized protein n=1 Tax=Arundo donax TaxID=35708 RepID=A0A0A9C0Z5_ARUDO